MGSLIKKSNLTLVLYGALALLAVGASMLCDYVLRNLADLPVKKIVATTAPVKPVNEQDIYPVLVKFKRDADATAGSAQIDDLFKKPEPPPEEKVIEEAKLAAKVDYISIVRDNIKVDAVAGKGALINGEFTSPGDAIESAAYMDGEKQIVPVLLSVNGDYVTVRIEKSSVKIHVSKS